MAKQLSDPYIISISGNFIPYTGDQPVIMEMATEQGHLWVAVFDDEQKLHEHLAELGYDRPYTIKKIDDGPDFLASAREAGLRVMLNPRIIDGEKTRWTEVLSLSPSEEKPGLS